MAKRMTKGELDEMATLGAFNPVDHAILAFADAAAAGKAKDDLLGSGFDRDDVVAYSSPELFPNLDQMMRTASGAAGFGYEVVLMRRYMNLAHENCAWLIVYTPDEEHTEKVKSIAARNGAKTAVRYGRLMHEDLV